MSIDAKIVKIVEIVFFLYVAERQLVTGDKSGITEINYDKS